MCVICKIILEEKTFKSKVFMFFVEKMLFESYKETPEQETTKIFANWMKDKDSEEIGK